MDLSLARLSIRWKIFVWCYGLALAIVGFNLWYATGLVRKSAGRSLQELQSFYNRYESFQASSSRFLTAAVSVWTDSRDVKQAFGKDDAAAEKQIMQEAELALTQTVRANFVLFADRRGNIYTYGSIDSSTARGMRAVADLRTGMSLRDTILENDGHTYLIAGEPIVINGEQVGALLLGVRLEQVFSEFKHQTDEDPARQVELALVHNLRATASSEPTELWDSIAHATRPEARETVEEGGEKVQVLVLPRGEHNFFAAQLNGYEGSSQGLLGTLYVMRNRLERTRHIDNLIRDTSAMALFALAGAAIVALGISVIVTRPLAQFIAATEDLAHGAGDLTKRLQTRPRDGAEVHQLAQNLNQLFAKLETLAAEVQGASLQVGASSAQISAASKQMLGGAKDQASRIEESTAAVTELSSSIQTVAENAIEATKVTQQSGESLAASIRQLGEVAHIIEDTAAKIRELGQSGKRIGSIVEVIRQISEQTSLLALNASIEAAHAGEQGRGFAVVADEVSSLARRVGQSAKDIEGLIGTIAEQTAQTVTSMQTATQVFGEHVRRSSEMQESLHQIIAVTQDTARSVQEQATVSDEIARNMDAVQKITHEVLGSSEEAVVQGEQLHALALKLEELVHGFRLEHDDGPRSPAPPPALPQRSSERRKTARS